jgi:hypothetical protein
MKAKFYAASPNDIPMTLMLTMPLANWVKVKEAIDKSGNSHYAACEPLIRVIWEMTDQAEKVFMAFPESPGT